MDKRIKNKIKEPIEQIFDNIETLKMCHTAWPAVWTPEIDFESIQGNINAGFGSIQGNINAGFHKIGLNKIPRLAHLGFDRFSRIDTLDLAFTSNSAFERFDKKLAVRKI